MSNSQNDVKISIVMPVYNTAPYLRQCLDSVLAQTLKEFELICVDDGSTDSSLEILEEYAEIDSRIIVKHQENMGPAIARNNALSIARGKYIAFMDGDDLYPENSTLEKLFNAAEQSGCKIAGGYRLILRNNGSINEEEEDVYKYLKTTLPNGGKVKYNELQTYFNYQCYIYSREFLEKNKITFPNYRRFQDPPFFVKAMIAAGEIYLVASPTYTYRWDNKIAWGNFRTKEDILLGHIDVLKLAHDYNLDTLYTNTLNRLVHGYTGNIFKDFSLDLAYIYTLYIEIYTIEPPTIITEKTAQKQMLTAAENEIIKAFENLPDDDIMLFTDKALEECIEKNSEEIYYAAAASLLRIAGNLKSTTATAIRLKITESYISSPYYNNDADSESTTKHKIQLNAAVIWYEQYKKIEKHNAELISENAVGSAAGQGEIKVSIILPVYNTAPYLEQCLDSILAQTLKGFELICVNDGSTDGSLEILKEYAKKDNRISIITQENQGLGRSRNNGLKIAKGEYIIFLDSDDVFANVLLEHTYNAGVEKNADIVLFDLLHYDHNTKKQLRTTLAHNMIPENEIFSWCDIPEDIFSVAPPNTCSGIYRHEFLLEHNLQFQDLPNAEDVYFTFYARVLAERITIVDEPLYYYRKNRPGSIETVTKNNDPTCFLQAFYALYSDLVKDGIFDSLKKGFQRRFFDTLIYNLNSVKSAKARLAILQALDEEPYCNLPIDEEPENYGKNRSIAQYFNKIKAARNWYHKNIRINQLGEELKTNKTAPPLEEQGTVTVSVVIPVYNTEDYLKEALDSIVNQTFRDIEIICVNDGSTDGSAEILDEYAKKDSRISIITQENKGQSCARNAGIMKAKGKYIYFMDSDDILETTAFEELIPIMDEKNLDVMCFDGESFTENPELMTPYYQTTYRRNKAYNDVYAGAELLKLFRQGNKYDQVVWLQLYKTSFLRENDIYFIPGILHEDNAFVFSIFLNAERTSHTNKIYFHRRLRENSTMTAKTKFENVYGRYVCYWDMLKTYYACLPNISEDSSAYAMQIIFSLLSNIQYQYRVLPAADSGSELGMTDNLSVFNMLVANETNLRNQLDETRENLKKQRARSEKLKEISEKNRIRKEELNEKLKNSRQKNKELKEKLKTTRQRKNELKEKLNSAKSKGANNKELEKYKKENEVLKKKLKAAKAENKKIKNSRAYKLSRIIMYIPHRIKMLFKK